MRKRLAAGLLAAAAAFAPVSASAETRLCNRTSVVTEAALAVQAQSTTATRGWFRLEPGQCRALLQSADTPGRLFLHTRPVTGYPAAPPAPGRERFCVGDGDFLIPGAERCGQPSTRLVEFAEVRPTIVEGVGVLFLSEVDDYDLPQARRAGVQRLLTMLGYDPGPIDGVDGPKTLAAIRAFVADRSLREDAPGAVDFFEQLLAALRAGDGPGFAWCNDTGHRILAALGAPEAGGVVTRGWFRIEPGRCLKAPVDPAANPRVFSFAEAVDAAGRPIVVAGRRLVFGGERRLCVRDAEFEIRDHGDCAAVGGVQAGFLDVGFDGRRRATVRFRETP